MADDDENEEISLADLEDEEPKAAEKPQAKAPAKPPPVPAPGTSQEQAKPAAPQVGLKDLETHLANERAERLRVTSENARLLAERDNAIRYAQAAEQRGVSTIELANDNQIVALTEQLDMMQAQHEQAMTDGDFKTASALQRKMGKLNSDLSLAEERKAALAGQREQMTQQHRQPLQRPAAPAAVDPLERAIANRTEPTKAFLRKHPDLIRGDGSLKRAAIDAHDQALDAGHAVDTPGYFAYIESAISPAGGGNGAAEGAPAPAPRQRAPTMAAPVERGAAPGSSNIPGVSADGSTFTVTAKMRRLAEEQGVPVKEWVNNYISLLKQGRITPIT
jgi:hypothetical protein